MRRRDTSQRVPLGTGDVVKYVVRHVVKYVVRQVVKYVIEYEVQ